MGGGLVIAVYAMYVIGITLIGISLPASGVAGMGTGIAGLLIVFLAYRQYRRERPAGVPWRLGIELPRVGRKRLALTIGLAALATVLWFWAASIGLAGLAWSGRIVVAGIAIPWGAASVALLWMERRIRRDLQSASGEDELVLRGEALPR